MQVERNKYMEAQKAQKQKAQNLELKKQREEMVRIHSNALHA